MDVTALLGGTSARWLVTGAAGFIGSHLVESLALAGQRVTAVDNFVTGRRANIDSIRAAVSAQGTDFDFVEGDVADPTIAKRVFGPGIDFVLHQAAIGSVPRSIAQPMPSYASNMDGFMQVLDAARQAGAKAFVYASSSSVYGDHPALPKVEDATGDVLSPYAATKAANEIFGRVYARCYELRTVGLRYFNVFGPRQDPEGAYAAVIPKWIASMLRGEPVYINGDGETSRDFCYIDNVVQANIRAAIGAPEEPRGLVLNIAVGQRTTLLELFELLRALLSEHDGSLRIAAPVFRDFRPGDVRHSLADIDRARRLIGYRPTHALEAGLQEALPWYLANTPAGNRADAPGAASGG